MLGRLLLPELESVLEFVAPLALDARSAFRARPDHAAGKQSADVSASVHSAPTFGVDAGKPAAAGHGAVPRAGCWIGFFHGGLDLVPGVFAVALVRLPEFVDAPGFVLIFQAHTGSGFWARFRPSGAAGVYLCLLLHCVITAICWCGPGL